MISNIIAEDRRLCGHLLGSVGIIIITIITTWPLSCGTEQLGASSYLVEEDAGDAEMIAAHAEHVLQ